MRGRMDTETLDKLYLEWSQFTEARNSRELQLIRVIEIYALDSSWRRDGRCDPNSGNFDGQQLAKQVLASVSTLPNPGEAK